MGLGVPQAVEFYLDLKEILEETDVDSNNAFSQNMQYNERNREVYQKKVELSQENVGIPLSIEELAAYIAGGSL